MLKIEYRVRPVTRYHVTRWYESVNGKSGGSESKGEFDSEETAYAVAYALTRAEHERLGYPIGDERVKYPTPLGSQSAVSGP